MVNRHYLELLAKEYPTVEAVSAEIINLSAICQLPKGTEYFFSDIHGEADAFEYLVGTASGVISEKIEGIFQKSVSQAERQHLSQLIYRPKTVLMAMQSQTEQEDWRRVSIFRLMQVCKSVASKYTRSKVRKKMPAQFAYVMDELLHADAGEHKEDYYTAIIEAICDTGLADDFIMAMCELIRRCTIDTLHIIGDVFDRGPHADIVIDELSRFTDVDVQWGNHDIHWMGAAAGSDTCIANVVRIAISYNNFDLLEDSYGINLRPLSMFAAEVYRGDPCTFFKPHVWDDNVYNPIDIDLAAKMHKAIAVIQFKLEGQLIARNPAFRMDSRMVLKHIDYDKGEIVLGGERYKLRDAVFPTIDAKDPLALTAEEQSLVRTLRRSFTHSQLLSKHIRFLFNNGSLYKIANGNLLYHGCIPMEEDGSFSRVDIDGQSLSGRAYLDKMDALVRDAYYMPADAPEKKSATDIFWYLWCGGKSPLFGKHCITTFERYFVADKKSHKENANPYFKHITTREACERILQEFGLNPTTSRIINGHVPVRSSEGESPVKGGGLLYVIDGGISKAYHGRTGIGGYTLISNSHNISLAEHRPFSEVQQSGFTLLPNMRTVERFARRVDVRETDTGKRLLQDIEELKQLLAAYREGDLREKR